MAPPEWRQMLEKALASNKGAMPYAKYYQVATVGTDGRPSNRTVVHRDFYGDSALTWVTDQRTGKVLEVRNEPWAEAAWYLEDSREQFRLGGPMTIIGKEHSDSALLEERQRLWSSLSPGARQQFTYPDPGQPRQDDDKFKSEAPPEDSQPLDIFCLVVHDIQEVDYVNLRDNKRMVFKCSEEGGQRTWSSENVNP
jgi:PPOX class probable FMN-dependent enzyme